MLVLLALAAVALGGCGDDDEGNEAERRGVGSACAGDSQCIEEGQTCLAFKGGYCGIAGCASDSDCPGGSACVSHSDGINYCFLICQDKLECNRYRPLDDEANCSSNVTFTDGQKSYKACVPPTG